MYNFCEFEDLKPHMLRTHKNHSEICLGMCKLPEVMDILFVDYVEEITAQVVGVRKMLAFFQYCFQDQEYCVTELGDEDHAFWDHKDLSEENSLFNCQI